MRKTDVGEVTSKPLVGCEIPPEQALMVACARGKKDAVVVRRLAASVADWESLAAMARWHGLTALLCDMLSEHARDLVPQPHMEQMERVQRAATGHGTFLAAEMLRVIKLLEQRGIAVMPYKAGALAAMLYDAVALRPMLDVDLFVRRTDALAAYAALVEDGYVCTDKCINDAHVRDEHVRDECEFHFEHPQHRTQVEIHWDVLPRYAAFLLDLDGMQQRAQVGMIFGSQVRVPAPEDLLTVLCVHGSKHRWERLKWLGDLRQVVRLHPNLDWSTMFDRARKAGVLRVVLVSLRLAEMLAGAHLPDSVKQFVARGPAVGRLAARLQADILQWPPLVRDTVSDIRLQIHLRERWLDRLHYAFLIVGAQSKAVVAG